MTSPRSAVLDEYRALAKECVDELRPKYDFRARWHRRWFRLSAVVVVVSGIALTPLTRLPSHKDLVVAAVGVLVSVLTALNGLYQWGPNWAILRRTHFELTEAYSAWQLDFRHAQAGKDPEQVEQAAYQATKALLVLVAKIRGSESDRFFQSLKFPAPQEQSGRG